MNPRLCLTVAAIALALAVALGAFGAHALKARLQPDELAVYHTAVQYHFWHALGLLGVGTIWLQDPARATLGWVAWLLLAGLLLFSGSLYALAFTGVRWLGAITPLGGVAFIGAWVLLAFAMWSY
jgi:uncharacterized membrane protein YgdD (TMEM256/DUF423 family)